MQGVEHIALRKYEQILESYPQFSDHKPTDQERQQLAFNRRFQKEHDFLYYLILKVSESAEDYNRLLDMTAIEIIDYYLSTQIHG